MDTLDEVIGLAMATLAGGGTLLYPTDTIWGIGCDATNPAAVEKVYSIKQRDHTKSMLILCSDIAMAQHYADCLDERVVALLTEPSRPTTVIVPAQEGTLAANLVASNGTIGVRIPDMAFCQRLLNAFGKPIVSTSANFSGMPSPSTSSEIDPRLMTSVDYKIPPEFGMNSGGKSSRIVKLSPDGVLQVLRDPWSSDGR